MKYSQMFGTTSKTVPLDLKATSHKLLYQGGFIRQVAAGRYAFLPLGYRVWQKIMNIIEEEMVKLGSQRILTPNLHPIEIWQATNRDQAFGDEMYIIEDHHGSTFALGATAEGLMVELVKQFNPSYKNLPIYIHQFSNKFRDEKRPKGGLLRVREFMMKDAYSFDVTEEKSLEAYQKFFDSYVRIAQTFNLEAIPVLADSGAIGGDYNHEFIVKSESGEGEALTCSACDYAAHVERAESSFNTFNQDEELKGIKEYKDDKAVTCQVLAKNMGIPIEHTTKTILFKSGIKFIAAMIRGDYDINEAKLKRHLRLDKLELASEKEVKNLTGAKVGFAGPIGLPKETIIVADLTCKGRTNFEVGANKTGIHLYNVNYERDMPVPDFADIRRAKDGDKCSQCDKGKLKTLTGIEWGHCFKLDQFYSKPHNGVYKDKDGKEKVMWMGSYGIGLGRSMATIVEANNDARGIIWPESVAPYSVHLVSLSGGEDLATKLYQKLIDKGVDVLWDDRDESAGAKLADADLIGIPTRLLVSKKTGDKIEHKKRNSNQVKLISQDKLLGLFK
jgi:prolyl-tRNA synthetase